MPIYEYTCSQCGHKFELLRPVSRASEDTECPKCQAVAKRVLSSFAAFSKDSSGLVTPAPGGMSSCSSCSGGSCSTCGS
jgi:putative FmdB family regulatory protein